MSPSNMSAAAVAIADPDESPEANSQSDRRVHARYPAGELTWINRVRLKYGPTMSLVDLSTGGVQIEIENQWLRPHSTVVVEIVGAAETLVVPSRVVRCQATGSGPSVRYRAAMEFKRPLILPAPVDANPLAAPTPLVADDVSAQAGWNKLVVRFVDGPLLKGYSRDFLPARGHFHIYDSPNGTGASPVLVPIGHLKAVFFVRDFAGNARYVENKTADRQGHGRKVAVTFLDEEVLIGLTLNYRPDGAGFVVTPCDEKSNNLRIFVSNRAVRHVQFL